MGGDHLAAAFRDFPDGLADLSVGRIELCQIALRIGPKSLGVGRIRGAKRVTNIGHIYLRIGDRLPGMRIGIGAQFERRDVFGGDDDRRLAAGSLQQPRQPALQAEAVDDKEFCIGDLLGVGRRRRIDVNVAVGWPATR